jgi:phosphoglycerol transferase
MRRWHEGAIVAGASLLLALISIKAWRLSLSVPFEYSADSLYYQSLIKGIIDHGWPLTNPSLGAPFGSQLYDAPDTDNLHFLVIKAMGIFSDDPAVILNLYWLLTFPATAVAAWVVLRSLEVRALPAMFGGLLFSLLPYHFWRGETQVFLSAYFQVPLACYLILRALGGETLFERREAGRRWARLWMRRSLITLAICVVIGSAGVYYAVFTSLLLIGAAIICLAGHWRQAAPPLAAAALIAAVLALNLTPTLLYEAEHGSNPEAIVREPGESEYQGLSLIQLLLPALRHRVNWLAEEKARYLEDTPVPSEASQSLGFLASAGLLWLFFLLATGALGRPIRSARPIERRAAVAAAMAFLIGTVGGVSSLIAHAISPQVRAWNRISVFIAFFALLAVALLFERGLVRLQRSRWRLAGPAALVLGLVGLAVYDQTPPAGPGLYEPESVKAAYRSDERFVARLERALPPDASVYQMPYVSFPEGVGYGPVRGYLHSDELRWSFGAMKGRAADLSACLTPFSSRQLLPILLAAGFEAIWMDRKAPTPVAGRRLQRSLSSLTGQAPLISEDGQFAAFRIDGLTISAARRERIQAALPADGDSPADCGKVHSELSAALAAGSKRDAVSGMTRLPRGTGSTWRSFSRG